MAKITINFADDIKYQRDLEAFCRHHGYQEVLGKDEEGKDIANPESKQDFIEATFKRMFKETSKAQRTQEMIRDLRIEE